MKNLDLKNLYEHLVKESVEHSGFPENLLPLMRKEYISVCGSEKFYTTRITEVGKNFLTLNPSFEEKARKIYENE